jgi:outer membrane protein
MSQRPFKHLPSYYLLVIWCAILLNNSCGAPETHLAATNFTFQETKIVSEKATATAPSIKEPQKVQAEPTPPTRPEAPARLTLLEAIVAALEKNQKIQVASYNPMRAVQDLKGAEAVYDPSVFSSSNLGRTNRPTNSLLDTGTIKEDVLLERRSFLRAGAKKFLPTGTTVSVYQETDRLYSNSTLIVPEPQSTSRLIMEVSQPLLKGFMDKTNQAAITIAKLGVDMSNDEFRQTVMDVVAEVARTYWQLVMERELEIIALKTVDMAQEVYRREQVRMEQGLSTKLDANRALSAMETRRGDLVRAQTRIRIVSDQLKLLLNYPETLPEIIPLEKPFTKPTTVVMDKALADAFKNRPELARAQKAVDANKTRKDLANHNRLPKLDAVFRMTKNALGGTSGLALDRVYSRDNNSWLAAVEFEYPLGNRASQAEYTKRSLEYDQASTEVRRVKDQIINEVSTAIREINLARKEIPTTLQAKTASEHVVFSENARFELGQKTNEELLRAQDLLANAERDYVRAVINYNTSLIMMNRAKGTILKDLAIEVKE